MWLPSCCEGGSHRLTRPLLDIVDITHRDELDTRQTDPPGIIQKIGFVLPIVGRRCRKRVSLYQKTNVAVGGPQIAARKSSGHSKRVARRGAGSFVEKSHGMVGACVVAYLTGNPPLPSALTFAFCRNSGRPM